MYGQPHRNTARQHEQRTQLARMWPYVKKYPGKWGRATVPRHFSTGTFSPTVRVQLKKQWHLTRHVQPRATTARLAQTPRPKLQTARGCHATPNTLEMCQCPLPHTQQRIPSRFQPHLSGRKWSVYGEGC